MKNDELEIVDSCPALRFISAGVACYAFSLLDRLGLIDRICSQGFVNDRDFKSISNQLVLKNAIMTLEKNNVLVQKNGSFFLTRFGKQLVEHRGSIGLIYDGYRFILANQMKHLNEKSSIYQQQVDWEAVAEASIPFGEKTIDPLVINLIRDYQILGTICDLGCGAATRLIKICQMTQSKGLGIEFADQALKLAQINSQDMDQISIRKGDLMNLRGIWPEVELIMQFFVMHDITPDEKCLGVLDSIAQSFPNIRYFFYCDVVAPSESVETQLPGFDYVHSLLGVQTRTYEETIEIFEKSKFQIVKEVAVFELPNVFVWVLERAKEKIL